MSDGSNGSPTLRVPGFHEAREAGYLTGYRDGSEDCTEGLQYHLKRWRPERSEEYIAGLPSGIDSLTLEFIRRVYREAYEIGYSWGFKKTWLLSLNIDKKSIEQQEVLARVIEAKHGE
ncbi:MAG: hypothetical protein QW429_05800 [Thermoprotei archaeon]